MCCVVCLHYFLFQLIFVFRLCMICRQSYDDIKHGEAEDLNHTSSDPYQSDLSSSDLISSGSLTCRPGAYLTWNRPQLFFFISLLHECMWMNFICVCVNLLTQIVIWVPCQPPVLFTNCSQWVFTQWAASGGRSSFISFFKVALNPFHKVNVSSEYMFLF